MSSISITPTRTQANATITVNGASVASGSASASISLNNGPNAISVVVTAEDGITTKTYTITVTRLSSVSTLSALRPNLSVTLSPAFSSGVTSYTSSVQYSVSSGFTITPTPSNSGATYVQYLGATAFTGALDVGPNIIRTVVTSEDGSTTTTYTITVTRKSNDASLSALAISSEALSPAFDSATLSYTASVSTSTITITPTVNQADATWVQYLGSTGTVPFTGALSVGPNIVRTVVTAQNGIAKQTYTVTVTLLPTLSDLILLGGPLSPTFTSSTKNYTASVVNATVTTTVTPTITAGTNASVKVNGTTVTSGSASGAISLEVGTNNVIQIVVTAQDGTTNTYTITVTRTSNDATLRALDLSSGELSPTFTSGGTSYTASVSNPTITITPTPNQSGVTTVQYLGANGTTPFTGTLNVGANVIRTVVTALNGSTTKTYTVTVTRIATEEAPQVSMSSPTPSQESRTDVQVVKDVPVTPVPAPKVPATSPAPIPANSTLMKALSGNKNVKVTVADLIKLGVTGVKQSNLPTVLKLLKGVDQTKLDVPTINKTVKAADAAIKKAEVAKTSKK